MTREEINHARTAYNCAVSVLRGFMANAQSGFRGGVGDGQYYLDVLRQLEREIEHWEPIPTDEENTK